jgi:sodium/hydrogen exchanger-like protein 3
VLICLGLVIGELIYSVADLHLGEYIFTPEVFFIYILPPIMLEAGYFMPKKAFFDNIGTICTYAVLGTIFNAVAIGLSLYGSYWAGKIETYRNIFGKILLFCVIANNKLNSN